MFEELLALKAEAEHEILYAKAKIEVVDKLMAKFNTSNAPVVETVEEVTEETVDEEIEGL
jgi:hypothetical protein